MASWFSFRKMERESRNSQPQRRFHMGETRECRYAVLDQMVRALEGKTLRYEGENERYKNRIGRLKVNFDENCCAPTMEQRYTFEGDGVFWMMDGEELMREIGRFAEEGQSRGND